MDASDFVQGRRAEAQKLWAQGDARGFAILNDAMEYLEQPLVKDLAVGNRYLAARRSIFLRPRRSVCDPGEDERGTPVSRKIRQSLSGPLRREDAGTEPTLQQSTA